MFKKKEKEVKLVPETKTSAKKMSITVIISIVSVILALILIVGGSILFNNYQNQKAMEESYKTLTESLNIVFTADKRLLTIEAAPDVTYSSTDALKNVPDQLRGLIASYTGDAEITCSNLDISTVGDKQVTVTITKADRFGQTATKQERIIVSVVDTQEPQVDLVSETVRAETEEEIKANILRVADPVFGYYQYSSSLENHTYRLDLSSIEKDRNGKFIEGVYPITIELNDSGNLVYRYFDVIIGNPIIEEEVVEEVQEQTTEETSQQEGNTENVESNG